MSGRGSILLTGILGLGGAVLDIDPAPRILGFLLGLGDLNRPEACMTYACGCVCVECRERRRLVREPVSVPVRFPWELAA